MAGARPPSPRVSPASKRAKPCASVVRVASTSLLRAIRRTSIPAFASVVASELHEDVDAVIARERRQAEVGDDEPLRRELAVVLVVARAAFRLRGHHIDAGLEIADRLVDRESRGDVGVEHRLDLQLALPGERALLVGRAGGGRSGRCCAGSRCRAPCRSGCGRRCGGSAPSRTRC